jgi:cytochrome c-type biogenesis protein CcmH
VLWPLSRQRAAAVAGDADRQFYADQIAEIERDLARGMLSPAEAEAARAEAGRRLLRASAAADPAAPAVGEPALRRRRAVSGLALSLVPILALAFYGLFGSPHLPAQPLASRVPNPAEPFDLAQAIQQIETHLQREPNDGRGWDVIAPVYVRLGRIEEGVKAYESALRLLGPEPGRLTAYGEALVIARDGVVPQEAREAFEQALKRDPGSAKARFYLARAAEQDGQLDRAKAEYSAILTSSPTNAPWLPAVKEQLSRLEQPQTLQAPTPEAIAGMVDGLAARLDAQGGTADEWARLLRSYAVLGDRPKAEAALAKARKGLARDPAGLEAVEITARDLKLTANTP